MIATEKAKRPLSGEALGRARWMPSGLGSCHEDGTLAMGWPDRIRDLFLPAWT